MNVTLTHGDILSERVDAIVVSANPWLNLSGGIGGALLLAGGHEVQRELHEHLSNVGKPLVPPGTVVCTGPGPLVGLGCKFLLHAVAIDAMYETSPELLRQTLVAALQAATERGSRIVAVPALATGYGPLSIREFCLAARPVLTADWPGIDECRLVLKDAGALAEAASVFEIP